jgi:hypothetical protein
MQQKGKKTTNFVFCLAETAALRCAKCQPAWKSTNPFLILPADILQFGSSFEIRDREAPHLHCMHLRPRNPPARPETETKKINTNKAKQFRRSHAEKESQPDRQTPPVHFDSFHEDAAAGAKLAFTAFMDRWYHAMLTAPYDRIY